MAHGGKSSAEHGLQTEYSAAQNMALNIADLSKMGFFKQQELRHYILGRVIIEVDPG